MPSPVDSVLNHALSILLPARCVLCGRQGYRAGYDLCAACEAAFPGPSLLPTPGEMTGPLRFRRSLAACAYVRPIDAMVQALKYGGQLVFGRVLGELLASRVAAFGLDGAIDCVLPVPLHPQRHAERGFNQSAEIARFTARALALPLEARLAVRRSQTRPQVGLPPVERRSNVRGAFATAAASIRSCRIAIVDDVITTGSTVAELARVLCEAGAAAVDVWCVARASVDAPSRVRRM